MASEEEETKDVEVTEKEPAISKKTAKEIKKEELIAKKKAVIDKKKEELDKKKQLEVIKKQRKKRKKLSKLPEPSQQALRAIFGGFVAVLALVALTYILWGIATDDSILYAGGMIDFLSMGNGFNALMGVWALSFTPLTSLGAIMKNWADSWYYVFLPVILAGVIVGLTTKRMTCALFGGLFFIFWGIVIPVIFVFIFSIFGITDPAIVDGILLGILKDPMSKWHYDWLMPLFGDNIFISWSAAGAIELGLLVTAIGLPIAALNQLIS